MHPPDAISGAFGKPDGAVLSKGDRRRAAARVGQRELRGGAVCGGQRLVGRSQRCSVPATLPARLTRTGIPSVHSHLPRHNRWSDPAVRAAGAVSTSGYAAVREAFREDRMRHVALLVAVLAVLAVGQRRHGRRGRQAARPAASQTAPARPGAPSSSTPVRASNTVHPRGAARRRRSSRNTASPATAIALKTAGLSLQNVDPAAPAIDGAVWEKVVGSCRRHDAAAGHAAPRRRPRSNTFVTVASRRRSIARPAGGLNSGSQAPASPQPHRIRQRHPRSARSRRRSVDAAARPTTRATASTTSPACCACRRRSSSSISAAARKVSSLAVGTDKRRHPPRLPRAARRLRRKNRWTGCRSAPAAACRSRTRSRRTPSTSSASS